MKTAMQELILDLTTKLKELEKLHSIAKNEEKIRLGGKIEGVVLAIIDANYYLGLTRQQIEDAYDQGNWDAASHKPDVINGKIYFTQTYEQ
jgi:hypothetical protein